MNRRQSLLAALASLTTLGRNHNPKRQRGTAITVTFPVDDGLATGNKSMTLQRGQGITIPATWGVLTATELRRIRDDKQRRCN